MNNNNQILGKIGEDIACEILEGNKYKIIERNFRCRQGEIDIIALDIMKEEMVFIEVKTRTSLTYGKPADAVDFNKRNHIYESARYYIYKNDIRNIGIRIDVMEIYFLGDKVAVSHIKHAF